MEFKEKLFQLRVISSVSKVSECLIHFADSQSSTKQMYHMD